MSSGSRSSQTVAQRVELALTRGMLRQWLQFETEEEAAAARALLARRKVRHVEALSRSEVAARHARAQAALAPCPPIPAMAAE